MHMQYLIDEIYVNKPRGKKIANTYTSLGTVNLVAPIDRNFIDISAIIRFRLCTFELPIE
jgi:hypothetical protein